MKYQISKHNIFGQLADSEDSYILNLLSGEADFLEASSADEYRRAEFSKPEDWLEKGYLVPSLNDEETLFRNRYLDFLERREASEIQIFWIPTYACNFGCSYCYQEEYAPPSAGNTLEVQAAFFDYVKSEFAGRKKYITVFGGEPLLPSDSQRALIEDLITRANAQSLSLAFVTNGYSLIEYIPLLLTADIREIQVTLDGIGATHNIRRPLKNGGATFEDVVEGIDAAIKAGLTVNLRMVLDRDNIQDLPGIAALARDRGWLDSGLFKTQLGRNYELHSCQKDRSRLYDRVGMYRDIYELMKSDPAILEFHKPAFSLSKFLWENGELPEALYDSCPGCKTEWAFDYTGAIYSCTATVGKSGEGLGTFFPVIRRDEETIEAWEDRDITTIAECHHCNLRLACGGGCASVAKNRTGTVSAPDCRPVDQLMELGLSLYFNNIDSQKSYEDTGE